MRMIARIERPDLVRRLGSAAYPAHDVVDHPVETELATVFRGVDLLDPAFLECLDLLWSNRSATADDDANVPATPLPEHLDHIGEILVVAPLVGAHSHRIRIFLYGCPDNVRHAAVVAQVHDFGAMRLQQSADHVDRGVVTVKKRGRGHETQRPVGTGMEVMRRSRIVAGRGVHSGVLSSDTTHR